MKVLFTETLKDLKEKPNKTESDLISIQHIEEKLATIDLSEKEQEKLAEAKRKEYYAKGTLGRGASKVKDFGKAATTVDTYTDFAKKNETILVTAGTTVAVAAAWYIGFATLFIAGSNPVGAIVILSTLAIVGAMYGARKLYQRLKFGANVITKKDFIKNLSMFALNKTTDYNKYINPFGEISILYSLEKDLVEYLQQVGCNNKTKVSNPELCIINVNDLCVTSVDRDCPAEDNDTVMIKNKKTGEYERFNISQGSKGASRFNLLASDERKAYQQQIDKKKQVTKGILKRMEKMFDSFGEAAMKETSTDLADINFDLLADGAEAGDKTDSGV
jgi:hypothetical protein